MHRQAAGMLMNHSAHLLSKIKIENNNSLLSLINDVP